MQSFSDKSYKSRTLKTLTRKKLGPGIRIMPPALFGDDQPEHLMDPDYESDDELLYGAQNSPTDPFELWD